MSCRPTHKMFISISDWSGSRPVVSGTPSSQGAPLGHSVVDQSHGAPAVSNRSARPVPSLQVIDGADGRMSQSKAQDVGLDSS